MAVWHGVILRIAGFLRKRRLDLINGFCGGLPGKKICDIGGSRHLWAHVAGLRELDISIYNISMSEVDNPTHTSDEIPVFIFDGFNIDVPDNYFDILICKSVLEHDDPDKRVQFG